MKKAAILSALVLVLATAGLAQNLPRFELSLGGGLGMTSIKGATEYYDSWSSYSLTNVEESTWIDAKSKSGMYFGGGFNFYLHPNFGIGLNFGYHKAAIDTVSTSEFYWRWNDGRSYTYNMDDYFGYENYFQTMPISFNLIGRFGTERFQGYIQAGPTLYLNKVVLDGAMCYGITAIYWYSYPTYYSQYVDAVQIPLDINQSWTGIGADFGAGFTFWLAPQIGISLEVRYFFCPKKEFDWSYWAGEYDGYFFGNITGYTIDQGDLDYIYEDGLITTIAINPSFLQFGASIKIRLM